MFQLYAAIWRVSGGRQMILILLSLAIAGLAAVPLEFQKNIINHLTQSDFETSQLYLMGAGMLGVVLLSLALKWVLGYRSGILGEDLIRFIRTRLVESAVESHDNGNTIQQGTLSTAISAEAEELGKFAGGAFSDPVVQIGTLFSVIGYISTTQPGLGAIALSMILPQIVIVLLTQRQVNIYVGKRVKILRAASNQISREDVEAATKDVLDHFDEIYETRRHMFIWKLSSKFILSAINGAGTVGVLMLGGYLVLNGRTDVGTVVAATTGLARIQGPTTYLIAYYRQVSANRIKFDLLREIVPPRAPAKAGK